MTIAETIKAKLYPGSTDTVRAAIYARVSTDNEGQKESCSNQVALAESYISGHPNIHVIGTYIDDGLSGKNDFTRPQYNEMLQQLSMDGFDLIITKSLSRLNRDELNSLMLNSMLVEHNATVLTLEDCQIHDFEDMNSALLHSVKYAMDAQFVKQQSINGRKTHELRCERKELSAKDCSYGYDWNRDDKTITINEEQASVVRRIFEEYVYRNGTPASIQRMLEREDINICGRTVSNIISDERYIGKFYINKRTTKLGTGRTKSKRISLPKEQWGLCERPDLQIVDTDLFEMAQRIHRTRITIYETPDKKTTQARFQGTHKYAGKIFCPVCGKPYHFGYADAKKTLPLYRIKSHGECPNPIGRIYEEDLEEITKQALKQTINQQDEVYMSIEQLLTEIVEKSQNSGNDIEKMKKQRATREKQLNNLIDQLSEDDLTNAAKARIKLKINQITEETDKLTEAIQDKESNSLDETFISEKLESIHAAIADLRNFTTIDRDRILNYIDRIYMQANEDIEIILKSGQVITVKQHQIDFSEENNVGKMGIQDGLYSSPAPCRSPRCRGPRPQ